MLLMLRPPAMRSNDARRRCDDTQRPCCSPAPGCSNNPAGATARVRPQCSLCRKQSRRTSEVNVALSPPGTQVAAAGDIFSTADPVCSVLGVNNVVLDADNGAWVVENILYKQKLRGVITNDVEIEGEQGRGWRAAVTPNHTG